MTEQGKKYLSDILQTIEFIELFTESIVDFNDFIQDLKTRSAVERQLGIIGEAINKFDQKFPGDSIENAKKIVGLRNRLIHAYDDIDVSIIWTILKKHLPSLKEEIRLRLMPGS